MPDHSPNLDMPFIKPSQAQKHVTHNEALEHIDALAQLTVKRFNATNPPADPDPGICYALGAGATNDWAGQDGTIAYRAQNGWIFLPPKEGWCAWGINEEELRTYRDNAWQAEPSDTLGINTSADTSNRLAVAADASLFTHDGGDHRLKINKAANTETASLLFQSDFIGKAEIGLIGTNNLRIKVSSDGTNFIDAMIVDKNSGATQFPGGITDPGSGQLISPYIPSTVVQFWRYDAARPGSPRTYTVQSVSGDGLQLSIATADTLFGPAMNGVAKVRVWNITKSPDESAWITARVSADTVQVTDATDISGWSSGDTLRLGDPSPTGTNTLGMVAVDISGYLQTNLGSVFRQKGVNCGLYVSGAATSCELGLSGTGAGGSAFDCYALSNGQRNTLSFPVPTTVLSPISNSNLLFVRESGADLLTSFVRILGIYV